VSVALRSVPTRACVCGVDRTDGVERDRSEANVTDFLSTVALSFLCFVCLLVCTCSAERGGTLSSRLTKDSSFY